MSNRLSEIESKVDELIASNKNLLTDHANKKEKEYCEEYGRNIEKLKKSFFKSCENTDKEEFLDNFFINNDVLKKKLAERKKLAVSNGLSSHTVRAEINSSIDFYLCIENVLVNFVPKNAI